MIPSALTVAGSDPSGGAGLQADLKTFHQFGVYGQAVVTLITVQNTTGVSAVHKLDPALVLAQLHAVFSDIRPLAMKAGALGSHALVEALAADAPQWRMPFVLDPVLFSKNGTRLTDASPALLFRYATLLTPNLPEAEALTGYRDPQDAARALEQMGASSVLIKGGHSGGEQSIDLLFHNGQFHEFAGPRISTRHTHGTGCTFSAALTALLATDLDLIIAVERAKAYITEAIRTNPGLGAGQGPVNHWA